MCFLMINLNVGIKVAYLPGKTNSYKLRDSSHKRESCSLIKRIIHGSAHVQAITWPTQFHC